MSNFTKIFLAVIIGGLFLLFIIFPYIVAFVLPLAPVVIIITLICYGIHYVIKRYSRSEAINYSAYTDQNNKLPISKLAILSLASSLLFIILVIWNSIPPADYESVSDFSIFVSSLIVMSSLGLGLIPIILGIAALIQIEKNRAKGRILAYSGIVGGFIICLMGVYILASLYAMSGG